MPDMWSERDLPIMSLWHDLLNNKEYMTRDGKYYVADALLVDKCLTQQRDIGLLEDENQRLRELVHKQDALTKAVHAYWAGSERSLDEFNVMMDANAQVLALMQELGIEVPE